MNAPQFKGFMTYRMTAPDAVTPLVLAAALPLLLADVPTGAQLSKTGFVPPFGEGTEYCALLSTNAVAIAVETAERLVPGKIVRRMVEDANQEFADSKGRPPRAREKAEIKLALMEKLVPRAFVYRSRTNAIIAWPYIFIETTSPTKAEQVLSCLRKVLGSLPVCPLSTNIEPMQAFSHWLTRKTEPAAFQIGEAFRAKGLADQSQGITGKNVSWAGSSLSDFLAKEYRLTKVELQWQDPELHKTISFMLDERLGIRAVTWPEALQDQADEELGEDSANKYAHFRATTLLIADRLRALVGALVQELGGERIIHAQTDANARGRVKIKTVTAGGDSEAEVTIDPLYEQAEALVVNKCKASVSLLQREFGIGYNRARQLLDVMEVNDIVQVNRNGSYSVATRHLDLDESLV